MTFTDSPTEQTCAVTDLLLAGVAFCCAVILHAHRVRSPFKVYVWSLAFALLGIVGVLGAMVHGLVLESDIKELLWMPIHLCLGFTVALFVVAAVRDRFGEPVGRRVLPAMLVVAVGFFAVTRLISGAFVVFLIYEAIGLLLALLLYTHLARTNYTDGAGWVVVGILITILAAVVQALKVGPITLVWPFDHNGLFHLIQLPGLLAMLVGVRASLLHIPVPRRSLP
jgi:hypothetical protein